MAIETIDKIDADAEAARVAKLYKEQYGDTGTGASGDDLDTMFQKLLIAQLKTQDPLDPMDNKDVIQQLASLNSLEFLSSINSKLDPANKTDSLAEATPLIGKLVSGIDANGTAVGGLVQSVRVESNGVYLNLGDDITLKPSQVKEVMNYSENQNS